MPGTGAWAVVLAAGAASRFGSPKQALLLEPVLERVRQSSVDGVLVVLGAHEVETSAPTVHCPEWEQGPGASLRCGLRVVSRSLVHLLNPTDANLQQKFELAQKPAADEAAPSEIVTVPKSSL